MPDVTIPLAQPGVASFELTDDFLNTHLLRGSDPRLSEAVSGAAGAAIERFEVVGFDSSGDVVPATWNADPDLSVAPIGVATAAAADGERVLYWFTGHFNFDVLVFDATFDTDAKKLVAFNGAPTPTQIRVSPRF